ncbi:hypothetical protein [Pseudonocardia sp. TMWB2A]|uniref:hypothetical protein n=1 Tax=Pseudonocardia sp. TMWB2A TaxID=687430 RepID=UPI00307DBACA
MGKRIISILFTLLCANAAMAQVEDEVEFYDDLVHSDVPLWGAGEKVWPQNFTAGDSWGCSNRLKYGDWERSDYDEEKGWIRLSNYGVFHCYIVVSQSYERTELDKSGYRYAYLVDLGSVKARGVEQELWLLQIGSRPGSDYLLLSRPVGESLITSFSLLQTKCPPANVREGPGMDIVGTRYCAINSQAEMRAFARRMAQLNPLAKLEWRGSRADEGLPVKDGKSEK